MNKIFIRSAEAITAQKTFNATQIFSEIIQDNGLFFEFLPIDYKQFIEPRLLRRMSKIIRISLVILKYLIHVHRFLIFYKIKFKNQFQ